MSTVKVNTVDKRTGSTLTLGGCGTTVTLGAGATQSGFGRTGTVDWCTTAKTSPFTGVSGKGYFVNTTCGAVTVTLPASPSAGDIISIADYASTWGSNYVTLCRNGSLINAGSFNPSLTTTGQSITLVYVDGTRGWKNTMDSTSNVSGVPNFIAATGGTITTSGDYKIHTFTSDGTFIISTAPTPANNKVDYLVVAGGGGGGTPRSGAGGAGGFRESHCATVSGCYTASPLASATSLPVSITSYPITVGGGGPGGGPGGSNPGVKGSDSIFSTITSAGGGYGGDDDVVGGPGGSGGGGGGGGAYAGGTGNEPPTSPPQGTNGGTTAPQGGNSGGGGGGATVAGSANTPTSGGPGGSGTTTSISTTPTAYAGGGGGGGGNFGGTPNSGGTGGTGGGGAGGAAAPATPRCGQAGTTNTGGGGGGAGTCGPCGGAGGSGIVIIRYKYQ